MSVQEIRKKYQEIYVIISPPRCSSTAFARVFWGHPVISFYCHEPFDVMYYEKLDLTDVLKALKNPLKLEGFKNSYLPTNNLVIKEMTFQVGQQFSFIASLTKNPIIFLIRDPRLSISSRIKKLTETGRSPVFPIIESGWNSLNHQINQCRQNNIPYLIVDSKSFRNFPEFIFKTIFNEIGIDFSSDLLHWKPAVNVNLGNLGDQQKSWYQRVLESKGIQIENESIPQINSFSSENGFRSHVKKCYEIYKNLHKDLNIVQP